MLGSVALQPVGLVVDDQHAAVRLGRDDVQEPRHERPAAAGVEAERERRLAAGPAGGRPAARAAARPRTPRRARRTSSSSCGGGSTPKPAATSATVAEVGRRGPREVQVLEQPVHERAAQRGREHRCVRAPRARRRRPRRPRRPPRAPRIGRRDRRQPEHALEVEAVAAAGVGAERAVRQALGCRPRARRRVGQDDRRLRQRGPGCACARPVGRCERGVAEHGPERVGGVAPHEHARGPGLPAALGLGLRRRDGAADVVHQRAADPVDRRAAGARLGQPLAVDAAGQDEPLAGARHGDVEQAPLLLGLGLLLGAARAGPSRAPGSPRRRRSARAAGRRSRRGRAAAGCACWRPRGRGRRRRRPGTRAPWHGARSSAARRPARPTPAPPRPRVPVRGPASRRRRGSRAGPAPRRPRTRARAASACAGSRGGARRRRGPGSRGRSRSPRSPAPAGPRPRRAPPAAARPRTASRTRRAGALGLGQRFERPGARRRPPGRGRPRPAGRPRRRGPRLRGRRPRAARARRRPRRRTATRAR